MTKILFVCHGNICRSPMAEFIMKDLVHKAGRDADFEIASAATSTEEIGNPVYPPARRKLAEHGIGRVGLRSASELAKKTARQMTRADYNYYDLIIGMDRENIHNMMRMTGSDPEGKINLLMEYVGSTASVADPWYTGDFEATWRDCLDDCKALLESL